jgi:hypothetical protein
VFENDVITKRVLIMAFERILSLIMAEFQFSRLFSWLSHCLGCHIGLQICLFSTVPMIVGLCLRGCDVSRRDCEALFGGAIFLVYHVK